MKLRRKWLILAGLAVLLIVLGVIVVAFLGSVDTPEAEVRRLLDGVREPGGVRLWLIVLGLSERPDPDPEDVLSRLAGLGEPAVAALSEALKDGDRNVRVFAAAALGQIGPQARAAVPAIIHAFKDGDATVRATAAFALVGIGAEAKEAVPSLREALKNKDEVVRWAAGVALENIQQKTPATRP